MLLSLFMCTKKKKARRHTHPDPAAYSDCTTVLLYLRLSRYLQQARKPVVCPSVVTLQVEAELFARLQGVGEGSKLRTAREARREGSCNVHSRWSKADFLSRPNDAMSCVCVCVMVVRVSLAPSYDGGCNSKPGRCYENIQNRLRKLQNMQGHGNRVHERMQTDETPCFFNSDGPTRFAQV